LYLPEVIEEPTRMAQESFAAAKPQPIEAVKNTRDNRAETL
jgi:hypothetical protein